MMIHSGGKRVEAAADADYLIVSAAPSWTDQDWADALAPFQHLNAYLAGMDEERDGTEIFYFRIPAEVAA